MEVLIFPVATVHISNGESFKFIIFNRHRFKKHFAEFKEEK